MTADKDGTLSLNLFALLNCLAYYIIVHKLQVRVISNVLAIEVPKEDKEISKVEL